jgi:hypothetical protein
MKTILTVSLAALAFRPMAYGQPAVVAGVAPAMEAGLGYSNVEGNVPSQHRLGMNGVQAIFNADFHPRLGLKIDLG